MEIGGFQKTSLIDYAGRVSAVVFTRGCPFRCPYCHNPQLVDPERYASTIPEEQVIRHLERRKGKLQGVVLSGGEPTAQAGLPRFLQRLKALGYPVKLDTNGAYPEVLEDAVKGRLVDYLAMDIKAPWPRYREVVRAPVKTDSIRRSVSCILASGLPHEFRTTWAGTLLSAKDLLEISRWIEGCDAWFIQRCRSGDNLEPACAEPVSREELEELRVLLDSRRVAWRLR
jgi:pyruvate formate lyase activating enzyme